MRILRTIQFFTCAVFAAALLIPVSYNGVQQVQAQGILVSDIQSTIQNTLQTLSSVALEQKEIVWDGLFYNIAQQALQQMTNDMLEWVNSGFDGEPMFVTDLLGYLEGIAHDVAADFIYGDQFSEACIATQLDVRIALAQNVQEESQEYGGFKEKAACTIDDIPGGDHQAFLSGSFNAGGWSMWFETILNPVNTPIGLYLAGENALEKAQDEKTDEAEKKLMMNDGFLSQEVCEDVQTSSGAKEKCTITTPGSIIKDQISFQLQIPALRLIGADEMNETIGALFGNLANQAMSGVNGLLGLGGNASFSANSFGASGSLSYLDAVKEEQANNSGSTQAGNTLEQALRIETQALELQLAIVTELDEIASAFTQAQEPYEDDSCWDLAFPDELTDKLDELTTQVPKTVSAVIALESMLTDYEANASSQAQLRILQRLTTMQSDNQLSGRTAVIQYDYYLKNELKAEVEALEEEIEDEIDSC